MDDASMMKRGFIAFFVFGMIYSIIQIFSSIQEGEYGFSVIAFVIFMIMLAGFIFLVTMDKRKKQKQTKTLEEAKKESFKVQGKWEGILHYQVHRRMSSGSVNATGDTTDFYYLIVSWLNPKDDKFYIFKRFLHVEENNQLATGHYTNFDVYIKNNDMSNYYIDLSFLEEGGIQDGK